MHPFTVPCFALLDDTWPNPIYSATKLYKCYYRCFELGRMDNHSPVGISLQIRDERGALPCGVHWRIPGYFPTVCIQYYTPTAEKCDVEHICFHSVRLLRDPSFGYPEHSNWQRGFWQCSNFTGFTHPTKQTNKRTGTKFALNAIATETETHVNHPVISPTGSVMEDRTPLKEGE